MWRDVARQCPHNLRARNDLAAALSEEGRAAEALAEYGAVLAAVPQEVALRLESGGYRPPERLPTDSWEYHYFRAHANMGLLMHRVLRDPAGAAAHYAAALRVLPGRADVAAKLRAALGESGAGAEP
jgi:tetratricopeptide (TPR) repeat protein